MVLGNASGCMALYPLEPLVLLQCLTATLSCTYQYPFDTSLLEDIQLSGTGPYIIKHNVDYDSDSSAGGFGTSGIFYTSQAGVVLTLAPSGTTSADVSGSCTKTFTLRTALQQGGYNESLDTSGSLGPYFTQDVVGAAKRLCRDFRVDLLDI